MDAHHEITTYGLAGGVAVRAPLPTPRVARRFCRECGQVMPREFAISGLGGGYRCQICVGMTLDPKAWRGR